MTGLVHQRRELLRQREILKNMRMPYTYGQAWDPQRGFVQPNMPEYLDESMRQLDAGLRVVEAELLQALLKLVDKLPRCEECSEVAEYSLKNGPYYCATHAQERSTAQKVEWAAELMLIFASTGSNPGLVTGR